MDDNFWKALRDTTPIGIFCLLGLVILLTLGPKFWKAIHIDKAQKREQNQVRSGDLSPEHWEPMFEAIKSDTEELKETIKELKKDTDELSSIILSFVAQRNPQWEQLNDTLLGIRNRLHDISTAITTVMATMTMMREDVRRRERN